MRLLIEFDVDADIVSVPQMIVDNREVYRRRFLKWLYNKSVKHRYWVKRKDNWGKEVVGVCFRSDAFVEWLNKKVLDKSEEKAAVLQEHVTIEDYKNELPSIFF